MNDRIIKPGCPGGVRDLLPEQAAQRRDLINRVIGVYELFGFVPLETSMLEREEVLTGGDPDFSGNIFRIKDLLDFSHHILFPVRALYLRIQLLHLSSFGCGVYFHSRGSSL